MTPEDVRRKVREHRVPFEVCFVVDNSYSLHADRLVEHVKGLVFRLLDDATTRGDRVSLVSFRRGVAEATVALRPTSSLALASRRLREIPLSGRTPLAHALRDAARLLRQERAKRPNAHPVVVVVSDGLPNVPLRHGGDPVADVLAQGKGAAPLGGVGRRDRRRASGVGDAGKLRPSARCCRGRCSPSWSDVSPDAFAALLEGA